MSDRDDAAAAYYEDPENRRLKGAGQKRARQPGRLTTHVPIRFSSAIIERVKDLRLAMARLSALGSAMSLRARFCAASGPVRSGSSPLLSGRRRRVNLSAALALAVSRMLRSCPG